MATNQDSSSSNRAQDQAHSAETSIKSTKTSFLDQVSLFVMPLLGVIILVVDAIFNERIDSIWTPEFLFHHALILLVGLVFSFSQTKKWKNVFPKRRKDWGSTWEILDPGWRTFWVALWVVAVISVPFRIYDIEWWLEIFILASILAFLAVQYRNFWSALFQFAAGFPVLFLLVLLAYGLVFGQLGTSQGIQHLFWSGNDLWSLVWASFGMTWLLAFIGNIAFLVDPDPLRTAHKIGVFRHYLADPSEVPFVYRLQGFLRTVRFPFLVVLGLPAVFPFLFYGVASLSSPFLFHGVASLSSPFLFYGVASLPLPACFNRYTRSGSQYPLCTIGSPALLRRKVAIPTPTPELEMPKL